MYDDKIDGLLMTMILKKSGTIKRARLKLLNRWRHEKADENFYITAYMVVAPISHLSAIELHCHKEIAGIDNMMKFFKSPYINRTVKINNNLLHDTNLLTYQFS